MSGEQPNSIKPFDALIKTAWNHFALRSERYVEGTYWLAETLFLAVLVSILFSARVDDRLWGTVNNERWSGAYYEKIKHPLLDLAKEYPPEKHEAKLNFRLTVPVLLHLLQVPRPQLWVLPGLAALGACGLILATALFGFQLTGDRTLGLYLALGTAATYPGSFGFLMYYDSIALAQIAFATLPKMPCLPQGILIFTAGFTDERSILASLLLVPLQLAMESDNSKRRRSIIAVFSAIGAYFIARLALAKFAGLTSPNQGIGWLQLHENIRFLAPGIWEALRGGWVLVGVAACFLWRGQRRVLLTMWMGVTFAIIFGGFCVEDVGRSVSYAFPAMLVALAMLKGGNDIRSLRFYSFIAFAVSILGGSFNVCLF